MLGLPSETDLETKERALASCAPQPGDHGLKHWRDQPDLMAFLRRL